MANTSFDFPACISCNFSSFCLLEKTNQSCIKRNKPQIKQQIILKRNEILYLPKKKFQNLYAIQKGALKTYQAEANGKEVIRGFYFAGEILGFKAIYNGQYLTSAVALTDTIVCQVPYDDFLSVVHTEPELQKRLLHLISQQLSSGSYITSSTAEQRIAAFLLDLLKRLHAHENNAEISLPMSRQDMGNYLNLTAETISRILTRLQQNKILSIKDKKIRVTQQEKLQALADGLTSLVKIKEIG